MTRNIDLGLIPGVEVLLMIRGNYFWRKLGAKGAKVQKRQPRQGFGNLSSFHAGFQRVRSKIAHQGDGSRTSGWLPLLYHALLHQAIE